MQDFDVCVRGNGAVGMSLALALSSQGLSVALLGLAPAAAREDLRTYALNAASVALLRQLKVWDALQPGARSPVLDMRIEGDAPDAALDFSAYSQGVEALAWIVDAAELEQVLHTATGFAPHIKALAPEAVVNAPLQVVAEGKASASRRALGVEMPLQPYHHRAVAARLVAPHAHGGLARQWFRSPEVLALLPFERPQAGRSYGLVWSVPDTRADELMALDDAAFEQALNAATSGAVGDLRLGSARASWPLMRARASAVCGPGWALVGDAAHVLHPLAGQGLNLGLGDVAALAEVLAAREPWRGLGDERLLQRYARRRAAPTQQMAFVTDGLWQLFASPSAPLRELRNRGLSLVNHLGPLKRLLAARALDA